MPAFGNFYAAANVYNRAHGFLLLGKVSARGYKIKLRKLFHSLCNAGRIRTDHAGNGTQDTLYFFLLLRKITLNIVIQVNNRHRFNKQGCAAARLVMHHAGEIIAVFLLNGYYIAVAAHGNKRVLKILLVVGVMQDAVEFFAHAVFGNLYAGTQPCKFGAGAV